MIHHLLQPYYKQIVQIKLKHFLGFHENEFNEAHHAKVVADYLGTDHLELFCTEKEAIEIFPQIPDIWDEPFGDPSVIPTLLVSRLARDSVTVALSADGGDEAFAGYDRYPQALKINNFFSKIPLKRGISRLMSY